jgi:hypothetical protein
LGCSKLHKAKRQNPQKGTVTGNVRQGTATRDCDKGREARKPNKGALGVPTLHVWVPDRVIHERSAQVRPERGLTHQRYTEGRPNTQRRSAREGSDPPQTTQGIIFYSRR